MDDIERGDGRAFGFRKSLTCRAGYVKNTVKIGDMLKVSVEIENGSYFSNATYYCDAKHLDQVVKCKNSKHYFQVDENNKIVDFL